MTLVRFSPFTDIDTIHRQMNRIFDELTHWYPEGEKGWQPPIELLDRPDALTLRIALPGIAPKDVEISVSRDTVTLSGEYHYENEQEARGAYFSEFRYGKFSRTIGLPVLVQNDQAKAEFKDGMVILVLPKVEEVKNRVIKLNLVTDEEKLAIAETPPETEG